MYGSEMRMMPETIISKPVMAFTSAKSQSNVMLPHWANIIRIPVPSVSMK